MKKFSPIAIIGQGCVYPDANNPQELFKNLLVQKISIYEATEEEWKADFSDLLTSETKFIPGKVKHTKRGAIRDFRPSYQSGEFPELESLGCVYRWALHAVHQALHSVGLNKASDLSSCGLILGNLLYATMEYDQYLMDMYLKEHIKLKEDTDPLNRFMGGLPAIKVAQAFGMGRKVFALDAACASSLYALKYACDELQTKRADLMVAAGVCAPDELFSSKGFAALNALSPSGKARPFHVEADGLIPSQGSGALVMKRLSDAIKDEDPILGVIRGIGISNDGKSGGFLSPSMDGQVRAMEEAIQCSGLDRSQVSFIECHATGTPKGDPVELQSIQQVYGDRKLNLGSIKGNLGHILSASGMAGILKVINGFRLKTMAGTPNLEKADSILAGSKYEVNANPIDWTEENKVAAVSNFGFGGNNAHVILQEWNGKDKVMNLDDEVSSSKPQEKVAIVGIDIQTDQMGHLDELYFGSNDQKVQKLKEVQLDVKKLGFPPKDLKQALGQQLLSFVAAKRLLDGKVIDTSRTGVFVGIGAQEASAYQTLENRLPWFLKQYGYIPDRDWINQVVTSIGTQVSEGSVLGTMPNIPANRLNNYFDIKGEGFTVTCEDLSGNKALDLAIEAIASGRLSSAIVCAADIAEESLQKALDKEIASGVVALLLKSESAAKKDGDTILSYAQRPVPDSSLTQVEEVSTTRPVHSANGLFNVVMHIQAQSTHSNWKNGQLQFAVKPPEPITVTSVSTFENQHQIALYPPDQPVDGNGKWRIYPFAGDDVSEIKKHLNSGQTSNQGAVRLAIVAHEQELQQTITDLLSLSDTQWKNGWITRQAYFQDQPIEGDVAFVYTGAAASYKKMSIDLMKAFPSLLRKIALENEELLEASLEWIYDDEQANDQANDQAKKLLSGSVISKIHTAFSTEILTIQPDVAFGISAGETNSLLSLGVIEDQQTFIRELMDAEFYQKHLAVTFDAVKEYWGTSEPVRWGQWIVFDDVQPFLEATTGSKKAFVTMIHTDDNFVLSGDLKECEQLIEKLGTQFYSSLGFDFAIHTPAIKSIENLWKKVHTRKKINPRKDIRFYSEHFHGPYIPTVKKVAEALTAMGMNQLDLRKIVNKAWEDGVRVFIEQGPGNNMGQFINQILKDKPHQAISFDQNGKNSLHQAQLAAAQLWTMGLTDLPDILTGKVKPKRSEISFRITPPDIFIPPIDKDGEKNRLTGSRILRPPSPQDYLSFQFEDFQLSQGLPQESLLDNEQSAKPSRVEVLDMAIAKDTSLVDRQESLIALNYAQIAENRGAFVQFMNQSHRSYLMEMSNMLHLLQRPEGSHEDLLSPLAPAASIPIHTNEQLATTTASGSAPLPANEDGDLIIPETNMQGHRLPGPKFHRTQLEELASGKISNVFGPLFRQQDPYDIQVRMPEPPLLLCDRVTGIQGEAGSMSTGIIWTESDVKEDSWYLHNKRMPPGILIESGQADLLLVSWMGVDFRQNKGERAYRLLGCELTFHGEMPQPGDTLKYEIHLDNYASMGDVSLFFFHYDCHINGKLRISVRNGQAGFFTRQELADSGGVLWTPEEADYAATYQPLNLSMASEKRSFSFDDIQAYQKGDLVTCFGESFFMTQPHTRTPRAASDRMNFIQTIPELDFNGGPAGRGYLRSVWQVSPDDWFFDGHFKNDQCMPGTLMADACLQMMAFYLVAAGLTQNKDGWRFQPVPGATCQFICRGQVTPSSEKIDYEVFVDEVVVEPVPTIYAHVMATVDGRLKIFMCERMALELVPDFAISSMQSLLTPDAINEQRPVAQLGSLRYDYAALIHSALGSPKDAFGAMYDDADPTIPCPRLPAPPYLFMSRVTHLDSKPGDYESHPTLKVDYDIPADAWYFKDNLNGVIPYAVLLEIALQPCGWLSTYSTINETKNKHLLFRNLDGTATQHFNITSQHRTIETTVQLVGTSVLGETIILNFHVSCRIGGLLCYEVKTVFGFFTPESMQDQKGHGILDEEQQRLDLPANIHRSFQSVTDPDSLPLSAKDQLLMIDRMDYFDPTGGRHGKGYIRGEKDVRPTDWYFKAHFYSDPVQPGSLGIEALIQLIQGYLLHIHPTLNSSKVFFEPVILKQENEWHYRGQVTPKNRLVILDFEVETLTSSDHEICVEGTGRLWVNGLKIYHCPRIGVRMIRREVTTHIT